MLQPLEIMHSTPILAIHVRLASIFYFSRVDSSGMLGLLVAFLCSSSLDKPITSPSNDSKSVCICFVF